MPSSSTTDLLDRFFDPKSIAIIGASDDRSVIRGRLVASVVEGGYRGSLYPVTRSKSHVFSVPCYADISQLPETPDLVIVVVPAKVVVAVLIQCADLGIRRALVLSSGFGEQSDEEGKRRVRALDELIGRTGMLVCGPNSEGFYNGPAHLRATFSPAADDVTDDLDEANPSVAVVSQSGGVGFAAMDRGQAKCMPVSHVVSVGNEAGIHVTDVVRYLLKQPAIKTIMLFIEGIKDGAAFRAVADDARRLGKALVVLKTGRTEAAVQASLSHTASLAGSYQAFAAVCRRHGVTLVEDIDTWVDVSHSYCRFSMRPVSDKKVAIMTASGGSGVLMADVCGSYGLDVTELDEPTRDALLAMMPAYGSATNPVDITAQGVFTFGYSGPLKVLLASPLVDMVIVVLSTIRPSMVARDIEPLTELNRGAGKPVVFCSYTTLHPEVVSKLATAGFPVTNNMAGACAALAGWAAHCRYSVDASVRNASECKTPVQMVVRGFAKAPRVICEYWAMTLLVAHGIDITPGQLVSTRDDAIAAFNATGRAVALKLQSADLAHKSDAGAVRLGLNDPQAVGEAFDQLWATASTLGLLRTMDGVLVQPMAKPGVEVVIGVTMEPNFGPMLVLGLGGLWTEVLDDTVQCPLPVDETHAQNMIDRLKGGATLTGGRGQPPADTAALIRLLIDVARFAQTYCDYFQEMDLNPVIVHGLGQGVTVVDALIVRRDSQAMPANWVED